jgi:rhamnogalacturonan endolyase
MSFLPAAPRSLPAAVVALAFLGFALLGPNVARAAFGLTSDTNFYTVDTGAGLVFKIRRSDNGSSTQSAGDIASLVYNGVEYQDQSRGSQVNSGFDWLYTGISAVTVNAATVGTDYVRVTVEAGNLTHYYVARNGYPHITMGTYFTTEPSVHNLCRYIVRIPSNLLPNGPVPSDIRNNTGAIESQDIFGLADGTTRSKHYSNMRLKDWSYIGATGANVGVWMVRDNNEGNSGGPFYRCLLNQCGSDQEITYMVNYGEIQTEAFRTGILDTYTLVFTNGAPPPALDSAWLGDLGLIGYVSPAGRGSVAGIGLAGRDPRYEYTVGFANSAAQYWATADSADGWFDCQGMLPGTYTMKVYKNEFAVDTRTVTVIAGVTTALDAIALTGDPSTVTALWRIGDWDGTPREFLNGDKLTIMHPTDARMSSWVTPPYAVGASTPAAGFPAYQWKNVNNPISIQFNLTADQIASYTLRAGITVAYLGGRPQARVNNWLSPIPAAPPEPKTRSLTVGSYRGNNVVYSYTVPASALVIGQNTVTLTVVSGSSGSGFLSPGCAYDAVDFAINPPVLANATASGTYGTAFTYSIGATNQPTSYAATGLPPGLALTPATGIISGTPAAAGTFAAAISATNANGTGNAILTFTITKAAATVTLGALTQSYDGTPKPVSVATAPAGLNVDVTYDGAATAPYKVGRYAVVATVDDPNYTGAASGTLQIVDTTPPVLALPANIVAEATGPDGAVVTFTASALDDVDGVVPVTLSPASGSTFALGPTTVTATASDAAGNVATGRFTVTVRDTTPPVIHSVAATPDRLWPAAHQMIPVMVSANATDAVSAVTPRIVGISSNEPVDGLGDGDMAPDWEITGDMTLNLRAERSGTGRGRLYTIRLEARDAAGNTSAATVAVTVPHDASGR